MKSGSGNNKKRTRNDAANESAVVPAPGEENDQEENDPAPGEENVVTSLRVMCITHALP